MGKWMAIGVRLVTWETGWIPGLLVQKRRNVLTYDRTSVPLFPPRPELLSLQPRAHVCISLNQEEVSRPRHGKQAQAEGPLSRAR